jgi:RNA polymerase sigma-70 factor (ECF subfamily)
VFHAYAGRVYNLARRMLAQDADAEDVTQEVLLQVVRKLHTFRGDAELTTWLHRVTVNAVLVHRRKRAYRPEFQSSAPLEGFVTNGKAGTSRQPDPHREMEGREEQALIEQAIAALPPLYRDVFVLSDVEQLTNPEIAALLGLSLAAVKSRLHRARLILRDALAPYFSRETTA